MGNHIMEHHRPQVNTISLIMSKATIVEIRRQLAGIVVTQSFNVGIITT
jgi:hypothetical protein